MCYLFFWLFSHTYNKKLLTICSQTRSYRYYSRYSQDMGKIIGTKKLSYIYFPNLFTYIHTYIHTYILLLNNTVKYGATMYSAVQYSTVQYSTVQYNTVQYSTIQYSTVQYSAIQYNTVQYGTTMYSTVQ